MKGEAAGRALVELAKEQLRKGEQKDDLVKDKSSKYLPDTHDSIKFINDFISPLGEYPHAYVLACIMDRQIKAERVWIIPYLIYKELGNKFDMNRLCGMSEEEVKKIFIEKKLHRFNDKMAGLFVKAVKRIHDVYHDDAREIWNGKPSSATLVCRFLEFEGAGRKIATMAANILYRQFGIKLKDRCNIDVSTDVHVQRIFKRLGLVGNDGGKVDIDQVIYTARALNPEYPGIIDYTCWKIGNEICDENPKKAKCDKCRLSSECGKVGVRVD